MHRAFLVPLLLFFQGCSFWGGQTRQNAFENASRAYEKAIEWSNFDSAAAFYRPSDGAMPYDSSAYRDFKITLYKTRTGAGSTDSGTVQRQAMINYVWLPRMSETSMTVLEIWEYSEVDKRWFLKTGFPKFR